jgi:hypothetical protein
MNACNMSRQSTLPSAPGTLHFDYIDLTVVSNLPILLFSLGLHQEPPQPILELASPIIVTAEKIKEPSPWRRSLVTCGFLNRIVLLGGWLIC